MEQKQQKFQVICQSGSPLIHSSHAEVLCHSWHLSNDLQSKGKARAHWYSRSTLKILLDLQHFLCGLFCKATALLVKVLPFCKAHELTFPKLPSL